MHQPVSDGCFANVSLLRIGNMKMRVAPMLITLRDEIVLKGKELIF